MTAPAHPSASADDSGHGGVQILVTAGPSRIASDLAVEAGGLGLGPDPHDLVAAGLAACTSMTLRLYAQRKAWALGAKGTMNGRAMVYGLGAMGEAGVTKALQIIHKELDVTMAF